MPVPTPSDLMVAIHDFIVQTDALDPTAPRWGQIDVRIDGHEARLALREPVAHALVEALRSYHDPRDRGSCGRCGGRRLDDNFVCEACGQPNGLFGQMVVERAARHREDAAVPARPTDLG